MDIAVFSILVRAVGISDDDKVVLLLNAGKHPVLRHHVASLLAHPGKHCLHGAVHRRADLGGLHFKERIALFHTVAAFRIKGLHHAGKRRGDIVDHAAFHHAVGRYLLRQSGKRHTQGQKQNQKLFHVQSSFPIRIIQHS